MSIEAVLTRRLIAFAGMVIGILIFSFAIPRACASFYIMAVPVDVGTALNSGQIITEPVLMQSREAYLKALSIMPANALLQQTFARLELRRAALSDGNVAVRAEALESASEHLLNAIKVAPSQPLSWSLETYALSELSAPTGKINSFLRMSYFLGPKEGSSLLLRARVACRIWDNQDKDVRRFTTDDLREIWSYGAMRKFLVEIYIDSSLPARIGIRESIIESPSDAQMLKALLLNVVRDSHAG